MRRLSGVIQVGPKCCLMCLRGKGRPRRKEEAGTKVMQPQVKECWPHWKRKEAKRGLSSRAFGVSSALPTP